jgi:hypothetical protein
VAVQSQDASHDQDSANAQAKALHHKGFDLPLADAVN